MRIMLAFLVMCVGGPDVWGAKRLTKQLVDAALVGDASRVEALIAAGADINARGKGGLPPLHAAASKGHAGVVKVLLDHGAQVLT